MEIEAKKYELAYLLSPSIPEEDILTQAEKVSAVIESEKGIIKHVESPNKIKLAYPVKKERNAFFGWTVFTASREAVKNIEKKIKEIDLVLRHLLVEKDAKEIPLRPIRLPVSRLEQASTKPEIPAEAREEKLDLEALDKKLEEILGR